MRLSMIEWRKSTVYPSYEVSEFGDIRRTCKTNCAPAGFVLKPTIDREGYARIQLMRNGKKYKTGLHKVVAIEFLGKQPSPSHQVAHNDGVRLNNHWTNLRWATPLENQRDRIKHGTRHFGARNRTSKLTDAGARDIKQRFDSGNKSIAQLAAIHGMSRKAISDLVTGFTWATALTEPAKDFNGHDSQSQAVA